MRFGENPLEFVKDKWEVSESGIVHRSSKKLEQRAGGKVRCWSADNKIPASTIVHRIQNGGGL